MDTTSHCNDPKLVLLESKEENEKHEPFEYPHFYVPTPLAQKAARNLQERLNLHLPELSKSPRGFMFGVLVVETEDGQLGYLSAYSGMERTDFDVIPFVPPVYQLPHGREFPEMVSINEVGEEIKRLEESDEYLDRQAQLKAVEKATEENIQREKLALKRAKSVRREMREKATLLPQDEREELFEKLAKESAQAKGNLKRFIESEQLRLEKTRAAAHKLVEKIDELKALRKTKSAELQDAIFKSYVFLNGKGETIDAKKLFTEFGVDAPPAGAGDCAAPKLFQYAYQNNLTPIAMAEFWWGASPLGVIREHGQFYPACRRKCEPILSFMLEGIPQKPNPLLENLGAGKKLEILFEDEHLAVVNKPAGLLSVPGKYIEDSVATRIKNLYPKAKGPLVVHRLDQDTSGIMILALTKASHKILQQQFLKRTISKTYVAVLEKAIDQTEGEIDLPLILDIDNRPIQMVSYEHGKPAKTLFRVLEKSATQTLIQLHPVTGRSHQLRVHCAHHSGLHAPILGDDLYGTRADRLHLHAEEVEFVHPGSKEKMKVKAERPFKIYRV
ncbi:MAG: pseudouridine synthase [Bacteroidota bacterium]